jgi:hypothetical protein
MRYRMVMVFISLVLGCSSSEPSSSTAEASSATSSSSGGGGSGGGGGAGASSSNVASSSSAASSSSGGGLTCPEPGNPLFGSCIDLFLKGCFEPDLTGTCTDMNGTITWSDGSKYVTQGMNTGLYGPGDQMPCISTVFAGGVFTATKGMEVLTYTPDDMTQMGVVQCPDGTSVTATFDQVTNFNRCVGINCP